MTEFFADLGWNRNMPDSPSPAEAGRPSQRGSAGDLVAGFLGKCRSWFQEGAGVIELVCASVPPICGIVALWATVATRRGGWGARVEAKLFALWCPPSELPTNHAIEHFPRRRWGATKRKQVSGHTRPPKPPGACPRPSMRYNFRNFQPSQPPRIPAFSSPHPKPPGAWRPSPTALPFCTQRP